MTRDELLARLREIHASQPEWGHDCERDHQQADGALLMFINDPEITEAFAAIRKWYA